MVAYDFCGRLGNMCWEIATVFNYCRKYNIDKNQIVFNMNHHNRNWDYDVSYYTLFFKNIWNHFKSHDEYAALTKANKREVYAGGINYGNDITFVNYSKDLDIVLNEPDTKQLFKQLFLNRQLRNELVKKHESVMLKNTFGVHVRRTDYLKYFPNNRFLDGNKLIAELNMWRRRDNSCFFIVFSDDIDWCKDTLSGFENIYFMTGNKDYEDLLLLSACKKIVRAGSSFSDVALRIQG